MRLKSNTPHHGQGEFGRVRTKSPMKAGAHMPMRHNSGFDDARGYSQSGNERRSGKQTGHLKADGTSDTRRRAGAEGNSKGAPPTALTAHPGVRGTHESHLGTAGRGGTGRIGKHDAYKGAPTKYTESISHDAFEKLGAD
jgi:hypothetical protein